MKITFLSRQFCRLLSSAPRRRQCHRASRLQRLEERTLLHAGHVVLADLAAANGGDGSTGSIIEGIDAGDLEGQSVNAAGDVNGDGIKDFIVSAHNGDHGSTTDDGEVYVVFGKTGGFGASFDPSTLMGANGFRIDGDAAADHAGFSVAAAGDVNNDGKADLVIGAPDADPSSRAGAGSAYVVFGAASFAASLDVTTLTGSNGFRIDGAAAGDALGTSVAAAGDVNRDGFADVILGAPLNDATASNAGAAYVIFGKASFGSSIDLGSLTATTGYRIAGTTAGDKLGLSVSSAGDLNNDTFADIVVGAPYHEESAGTDAGAAYVVFGKASGFANIAASSLNGTTGFRLEGLNASDQLGLAASSAGDVNDDGLADLIVASPRAEVNGVSVGASYVVFGKVSAFSSAFSVSTLTGSTGFRIAMDYSSDPWLSSWIVNTTGATGITNGVSTSILADVLTVVPDGNDVFVKANSVPSYSVGPWPGNPNIPSAQNRSYQIPRDPVVNNGTKTVTGLGANGITIDGVQIYNALDGRSFNNQNVWHQNAYFSEGSTLDANGGHADQGGNYHIHKVPDSLLTKLGDNNSTHSSILGWSFDGFPIYGSYGYMNADGTGGIVRMDSSWQTRSITTRTTYADGSNVTPGPNVSVASPIGTYVEDYQFVSGSGHLDKYNGRFSVTPEFPQGMYHYVMTLNASLLPAYPYILAPELYGVVEAKNITKTVGSPNDIGVSVASIGDFNADGVDDVIIGNPGAYVSGAFVAGAGYVYYGHTGAFAANFSLSTLDGTTNGFFIYGIAQNDFTGTSVSGGVDINGDGGFDLLIGAPGADPSSKSAAGRAFAVYGDSLTLSLSISPNSISENGGTATGTITRPGSTTSALVVTLASNDVSEATVPTTVTIAAGQSSATFTVTAVDDAVLDGSQSVTLTASAAGFSNGLAAMTVTDYEALTVNIADAQIAENGGATTLTVTRTDSTGSLTVMLLSDDTTEAVIVATVIIAAGQLTSATVTINAVDDDEVDGNRTVIFTASATGYVAGSKSLNVIDNEVAGFTIVQTGGTTSVSESGSTDTLTVALNARPLSNVVINVTSGDTGEATVGPATLTFTPANYNTPQTVTVTGVNDPAVDGDQVTTLTLSINDATSDNAFDPLADQTVSATTTDNDVAEFTVAQSAGNTTVGESGSTDTFTVVLNAQPLSNVVINVSSGDTTEATVGPTTLTFTPANWNTAQTVTVTGVDDLVGDGDQTTAITVSVNAASSDDAFDAVSNQTISAVTTDNEVVGLTITQSGGSTIVSESGTTDSFDVVLKSQPTSNVVLLLSSGNTGEVLVGVASLTFTSANWNIAQTVTVTGVDDFVADGSQITTLTIAVDDANSDPLFAAFADQTLNVTTTDNEIPGFTIAQTGGGTSVTEAGSTDTFSVVLNVQPAGTVVITVSSGDTGEATVGSTSLTFTTANWNTPQTVTVTGVDDVTVDGNQVTVLTLSINDALSQDGYDNVADQTVSATTTDNDVAGFTVVQSGGSTTVNESGTTDSFTVVLNAQPLTNVVVTVVSGDIGEATVSPATLSFTPANWNTAQTVTVTGINDVAVDGTQNTAITLSINDAASDAAFASVADQIVSASTLDNDMPGFAVTQTGGTTQVSETGSADQMNVVLTAQPLSNVVILVSSGDTTEAIIDIATLTFTPANWNVAQTVTVTGVDDVLIDGTQVSAIAFAIDAANSDDAFDSVGSQNVNVSTTDNDVAGFVLTQSGGSTTVSEAGTSDTISVVLVSQPTSNVVILIQSSDTGEATVTSALTFLPGNWNVPQTVTVTGVADLLVDGDQVSTLTFSIDDPNSDNAFDPLANQTVNVTTTDTDSGVFSVSNASAAEGTGVSFTITLSKGADVPTSVTFSTSNGTATLADSDYSAVSSQVVSFAAGVTSQIVTVNTTADAKVESDETFTVTLGGLVNAGRSLSISGSSGFATGTILNNDTDVTVSVAPDSVIEDGATAMLFTFTRVGVTAGALTANFSVGGTAMFSASSAASDYLQAGAGTFTTTAGTVVFADGVATTTVSITPKADSNTELDETIIWGVAAGAGYSVGATSNIATGTIRDDDAQISLSLARTNVAENGATNLIYTFTRAGSVTNPLTVNFDVSGVAEFGTDYSVEGAASFNSSSGSITFAAGSNTATLTVDPLADATVESDETVRLTLTNSVGYLPPAIGPVTGTIDNDDFGVSLSLAADRIAEDVPGTLVYTLSRTGGVNLPLAVRLLVSGSAFFGFDYSQSGASSFGASAAFVTFASGASTATVQIDPTADSTVEPDETVVLTLLTDNAYNVAGASTQTSTILNDDQRVGLVSSTTSVVEDGAANLIVSFIRIGKTDESLTIPFTLAGTATLNADYAPSGDASFTATGGSLTFAPGVTSATLTFDPVSDNILEPDEVVLLTLPTNASLGVVSTIAATGVILNDDSSVSVAASTARATEAGTANLVYTFHRFGDLSREQIVNFTVGGTAQFIADYAQSGADSFNATSGSVKFPAGATSATVTLDPLSDSLLDPNETAILTVVSGLGYSVVGDPAVGTIISEVPVVSLAVSPISVEENGSANLVYTFTRAGDLNVETTVEFTVGGSATYLADYQQTGASRFISTEGAITFVAGARTAVIRIAPSIDSVREGNETVVLTILQNNEQYQLSGTGVATGTITDSPLVSVVVSPGRVTEDGAPNLSYTFSRTGSTTSPLTVNFQVGGSATFGTDYTQTGASNFSATTGTVTFAAGSATKTLTVNPTADFDFEADETVVFTITADSGLTEAGDSSATGVITNDDVDLGNIVRLDNSGQLLITDPVNRNDRLVVTKNSVNELVITDSANRLTTSVGRLVSIHEVRVPLSSIPNRVLIANLSGGADSMNLSGLAAGVLSVTVYGGAGNDTILGSGGNDTLLGGDGNDSIDGGLGNDGILGDAGNDTLKGSSGNDTILGGLGNDSLLGGSGNDLLMGEAGNDRVFGETGVDRIAGGSGSGRDSGDVVTDNANEIDEALHVIFDGLKFLLV